MNNKISLDQWNELVQIVNKHTNHNVYSLDEGHYKFKNNSERYYCYDNEDSIDSPGLDFVIKENETLGTLTVHNASEEARAPITFEQGKTIARFFWDDNGSQLAEDIVCDWIMDGNKSVF